jgi:hypothetical protein
MLILVDLALDLLQIRMRNQKVVTGITGFNIHISVIKIWFVSKRFATIYSSLVEPKLIPNERKMYLQKIVQWNYFDIHFLMSALLQGLANMGIFTNAQWLILHCLIVNLHPEYTDRVNLLMPIGMLWSWLCFCGDGQCHHEIKDFELWTQ